MNCILKLSIQLSQNRGRKENCSVFASTFFWEFFTIIFPHRTWESIHIDADLYSQTRFGFAFQSVSLRINCFIRIRTPEGGKNAWNTFNIPLNTFEFRRKFQLSTFFHFSTEQTKAPHQKQGRENLCERAPEPQAYLCSLWYKNMCKIFLLRLHYVIFTIFHRRVLLFRRLSFTQNYFLFLFSIFTFVRLKITEQFSFFSSWGGSMTRKKISKKFFTLLLRYCVTADDFFNP